MEVTERFAELMARDEDTIPLDLAALLIAAHARPGLDVERQRARLDELADSCPGTDLDDLVAHLFGRLGFVGNADDYYDPRNSYLPHVLDTHRGIPISLSVVTISVGARVGIPLVGVGMPGHFLVRAVDRPDRFLDPFGRGAALDQRGCEALFHALHGPEVAFHPAHLAPVGPRAIAARMLANLGACFRARDDKAGLVWALRLRTLRPGGPPRGSGRAGRSAGRDRRLRRGRPLPRGPRPPLLGPDRGRLHERRRPPALTAELRPSARAGRAAGRFTVSSPVGARAGAPGTGRLAAWPAAPRSSPRSAPPRMTSGR